MCGTSLLEGVVSITDHSSDLPCAVIVLPDMHEFRFAACHVILSCLLLVKPMGAYLDCAIAGNRVHRIPVVEEFDSVLRYLDCS